MAEEKKWYFAKDGKPVGPMGEHELCNKYREGAFGSKDYVYCKGETDGWVKAATVPGLCDEIKLDAEPPPQHHEVPLYEKAAFDHKQDDKKKPKPK
jgi:hypothetical protein